jgi:hypothetical protein
MFRRETGRRVRIGAAIAVAAIAAWTAAPVARQIDIPPAASIIARHVEAIGGEAAFKAIQSYRATGTISIPSQQITGKFEVFGARPSKGLVRASIPGIGESEDGYDGKIGWSIDPVNGPSVLSGRELLERADDAWFDATLYGKEHVKAITVLGRETFDRRPAYKLKVVKNSGIESTEFFDVETGLQLGEEAVRETPFGAVPTTSLFRDYKEFAGIRFASTHVQRILGIEQVITISTYEFNKVPASTFDLPAVIKAIIK